MTTAITLYLLFGLLTYWPAVHFYMDEYDCGDGKWYEWLAAWIVWTTCWPYRYTIDAWYWWRAGK